MSRARKTGSAVPAPDEHVLGRTGEMSIIDTAIDPEESPADVMGRLLEDVLERSAPEGARVIALHWLLKLEAARNDWQLAVDPPRQREASDEATVRASGDDAAAALHKTRVALRRLRASLNEYRALLVDGPSRKQLRHLQTLNRATGDARDADVQREWLVAQAGTLPEPAQREAAELVAILEREAPRHAKRVRAAFRRHFDGRIAPLRESLTHYTVRGTVGVPLELHAFARQVAVRLDRSVSKVVRAVGAAHRPTDVDALHRARKALKALRALLVPFVTQLPSLGALYESATRGQDTLGAMRDASLLAARARAEHMLALGDALALVEIGHFNAFATEWMDDAGIRALAGLSAARHAFYTAARTADELSEAREQADALPMEIERKYLLRGCPPEASVVPGTRIEQGWIPGRMVRERLRCSTYPTGVTRYTRTVKAGSGIARVELEDDTTRALFETLWPLTVDARVRKRRHAIRVDEYTWEIDVFTDRDLVLAEVEMKSANEQPPLPSWLAPWVVREVTGEREYYNSSLARPDADAAPAVVHESTPAV